MTSTGSARKIDALAAETLKVYNAAQKNEFELITEGDTIIIRKCAPTCALCNATRNTKHFSGKLICQDCIEVIKEVAGR